MTPGTCRFCSCQEDTPCSGGCAWTDDTRTLCTVCLSAATVAMQLVKILGAVERNPHAPVRIVCKRWDDLTLASQQVLVMVCRAYLEAVQQHLKEEQTEEAVEAFEEIRTVAAFFMERCPDELREGETFSATLIRLLEPHVGKRVVLAGGR